MNNKFTLNPKINTSQPVIVVPIFSPKTIAAATSKLIVVDTNDNLYR